MFANNCSLSATSPASCGPRTTPTGARPLIVIGHGGGQHKKHPGVVHLARRFVTGLGAAVVSVDVPSHGDRPPHPVLNPTAVENQARIEAGEDVAPWWVGYP